MQVLTTYVITTTENLTEEELDAITDTLNERIAEVVDDANTNYNLVGDGLRVY